MRRVEAQEDDRRLAFLCRSAIDLTRLSFVRSLGHPTFGNFEAERRLTILCSFIKVQVELAQGEVGNLEDGLVRSESQSDFLSQSFVQTHQPSPLQLTQISDWRATATKPMFIVQ